MTMTVDEARLALESLRTRHWDCLDAESREAITVIGAHQDTLAAEVERLRAMFQQTHGVDHSWVAEVERLQKVIADQALTIGTLKDEQARLTLRLQWITGEEADRFAECGKLREEAQTARLALDVALKEVERLKAEAAK